MVRLPQLRVLALTCLVFTWLVASLAPSLLVHLTVRSRILVAAAQAEVPVSMVTRALLRGQLCGVTTEVTRAEQDLPEEQPANGAETAKVVLCLLESQPILLAPVRPGVPRLQDDVASSADPASPLGPPPRRV
jgi:hypothetical protein